MNWLNGLQDLFKDRLFSFFLNDECNRIIHSKSPVEASAGSRAASNCYSLYLHSHEEMEVSVVLSGEYLLECEGRTHHMKPGDISVIGSNEKHRDRIFDYQSAYNLAVLGLRGGSFCLLNCGYRPEDGYFGFPAHTWIRVGSNTMLDCLLGEVHAKSERFAECFYAYLKAFYLYIHDRIFSQKADEVALDVEYELFTRVCQYIHANMNHRLSTRDICAHFGLNEQYVCRMFHKYSGSTVLQEINHARTMEAVRLLRQADRKVSDIAFELGFEDPYYFTRVFTSLTGMSPKMFRSMVFSSRSREIVGQQPRGTFYKRYLTRLRPCG